MYHDLQFARLPAPAPLGTIEIVPMHMYDPDPNHPGGALEVTSKRGGQCEVDGCMPLSVARELCEEAAGPSTSLVIKGDESGWCTLTGRVSPATAAAITKLYEQLAYLP